MLIRAFLWGNDLKAFLLLKSAIFAFPHECHKKPTTATTTWNSKQKPKSAIFCFFSHSFSEKRTIRGILSRNLLLYRFEKDHSSGRFGENRRRSFLSSFSLKAGELPVHSPLYRRLCFQCHKIGNEPVGHSRRRRRNQPICFCLLPQIKSSGDSSLNNKKNWRVGFLWMPNHLYQFARGTWVSWVASVLGLRPAGGLDS